MKVMRSAEQEAGRAATRQDDESQDHGAVDEHSSRLQQRLCRFYRPHRGGERPEEEQGREDRPPELAT